MLSVGLWRWYINITITILDIINRPVFYLKHNVSETGFFLRLQMETTQLGHKDRVGPCLPDTTNNTNSVINPTQYKPIEEVNILHTFNRHTRGA
jgi:hypothetical protein